MTGLSLYFVCLTATLAQVSSCYWWTWVTAPPTGLCVQLHCCTLIFRICERWAVHVLNHKQVSALWRFNSEKDLWQHQRVSWFPCVSVVRTCFSPLLFPRLFCGRSDGWLLFCCRSCLTLYFLTVFACFCCCSVFRGALFWVCFSLRLRLHHSKPLCALLLRNSREHCGVNRAFNVT